MSQQYITPATEVKGEGDRMGDVIVTRPLGVQDSEETATRYMPASCDNLPSVLFSGPDTLCATSTFAPPTALYEAAVDARQKYVRQYAQDVATDAIDFFEAGLTGDVAAAAAAAKFEKGTRSGLKGNIPFEYNGYNLMLAGGGNGYDLSLVRGGVRLYMSRRQGVLVQVGSDLSSLGFERVQQEVDMLLRNLGFEIRSRDMLVTRLDWATDLEQALPDFERFKRKNGEWVGRAGGTSAVYFDTRSGDQETVYVGAPSGAIRLRFYDKLKKYDQGDLAAWGVKEHAPGVVVRPSGEIVSAVTRWEFQLRLKAAGFLVSLADLAREWGGVVAYLMEWGRLVVPNPSDSNKRRWLVDPTYYLVWECLKPAKWLLRRSKISTQPLAITLSRAVSYIASFAAKSLADETEYAEKLQWSEVLAAISDMMSRFDGLDRVRRRVLMVQAAMIT